MKHFNDTFRASYTGANVLTVIDMTQGFNLSLVMSEIGNVNNITVLVEVCNTDNKTYNANPVWSTLESITVTKNTSSIKNYTDFGYARVRITLTSAAASLCQIDVCGKMI